MTDQLQRFGLNSSLRYSNKSVAFDGTTNYKYTGLSITGGALGSEFFVFFGYNYALPLGLIISRSPDNINAGSIEFHAEGSTTYPYRRSPVFFIEPGLTLYVWEKCNAAGRNTTYLFYRSIK